MKDLCQAIAMPQEVTDILLSLHNDPSFTPALSGLRQEERWSEAVSSLQDSLAPDPDGFKMLLCMLRCALEAWEDYKKLGISRQIYIDSMACFTRFVREHQESFGRYGFDRYFWTVRQVSGKLFRIGQLEYELIFWEDAPAVSLHIPSDANLSAQELRASWQEAKHILNRCFPAWAEAPMVCHSWLLSPTLEMLLPATSRILAFQRSFTIQTLENPTASYARWVFKDPKMAPADYPENTSLQRSLKAHILGGGSFADARGVLSDDPFRF